MFTALFINILIFLLPLAFEGYGDKFSWLSDFSSKLGVKKSVRMYVGWLNKIFLQRKFMQGIFGVIFVLLLTIIIIGFISIFMILFAGNIGYLVFLLFFAFILFGNPYFEKDEAESYLIAIHERAFGVIFWLIILGLKGAVMYWLLLALRKESLEIFKEDNNFVIALNKIHKLLAWVPVRITGMFYAFVGNFSATYKQWVEGIKKPSMPNDDFLLDCGKAAVGENFKEKEFPLAKRALIVWCCVGIVLGAFI